MLKVFSCVLCLSVVVFFSSILIYINFINVSLSSRAPFGDRGYLSRVFGSTLASSLVCTFLFSFSFFWFYLYCLVSAPLTVLLSGTFADATQINYDSLFI